jgi:polar amino acid transport system substrate-binding protein
MMKKSLLGLALLLSIGLAVNVEAAEHKAVVATAGDIKPFSYQDKKGNLTGYDIEVINQASKYIDGYEFTFKKTAWDSIFVGLDSDIYQVAANNLSYTKERASKYLYSVPIAKNPLVLVTKDGSDIKSPKMIREHQQQNLSMIGIRSIAILHRRLIIQEKM